MMRLPIGLGSILGMVGAAAGLLIPAVSELADATSPLGVPPGVWVVCGAVLAALVVIGRYAQAVTQLVRGVPAADDLLDVAPVERGDVDGPSV